MLCELLHACLDEFTPVAIQDRESADGWRVFFKTSVDRDRAATAIRAQLGNQLRNIHALDVDDEGWARRSQAGLKAIRVGRIVVAPPWDCESESPDIRIVIDPSMGFGTGHHETTRLCLALLQTIDVAGRRAIDVGTGSGVLAIAAAKLRASTVLAIDHDPDALENARENARRNGCADAIEVREVDLATAAAAPAEIVTANLTAAVLERYAARLMDLLKPGGMLIASGFGPDEQPDVVRAFDGMTLRDGASEGAWSAVLLLENEREDRRDD
ncbi:MAG TPA: 50S ribosomal protein L11 methyltransferase [Vicinamibacterales bacterium]|jgi:ribosomal protein L11 methyltransferase